MTFFFSPWNLGKMNPFGRAYFSDGLVQPPTRYLKVKIDGLPMPKGRLGFRVLINQYVGTVSHLRFDCCKGINMVNVSKYASPMDASWVMESLRFRFFWRGTTGETSRCVTLPLAVKAALKPPSCPLAPWRRCPPKMLGESSEALKKEAWLY